MVAAGAARVLMGLDVTMNVSVADSSGGGGGRWRAPKDDIIQVVKTKGSRTVDQDEVSTAADGCVWYPEVDSMPFV